MGRWAQRRLRGGGEPPSPGAATIHFTAAHISGLRTALITYSGNITAADFDPADFESDPVSGDVGIAVAQTAANQLTITYTLVITLDAETTYSGAVSYVLSPDDIAYT